MESVTEITEKDVYEYREIYYEYFKRHLSGRFAIPDDEAESILAPALEKFGWTLEKYQAFGYIDFAQRLAKMKAKEYLETGTEPKVEIRIGNFTPNSISLSRIPELKCPLRTTQKD